MKPRISLLIFVNAFALNLWAAEPLQKNALNENACLTPGIVADVSSDFAINTKNTQSRGYCETNDAIHRIIKGLAMLKYAKFERPTATADQTYAGVFNTTHPYDYLKSRIQTIEIEENCSNDTQVAYVMLNENQTMHVCANRTDVPAAFYMGTLVHEAQHSGADSIRHVTCERGFKKGKTSACDQSVEQRGSYFFDFEYNALVAKFGSNFHPAMKSLSRGFFVNALENNFNEKPRVQTQSVILALTQDNEMALISSDMKLRKISSPLPGRFFNLDASTTVFYESPKQEIQAFDAYMGLRTPLRTAFVLKTGIRDYSMASQKDDGFSEFSITEDSLFYYFSQTQTSAEASGNRPLPFRNAERFIDPTVCSPADPEAIFIETRDNQAYEVLVTRKGELTVKQTDRCDLENRKKISWNQEKFALGADGVLLKKAFLRWKPVEGLENVRFKDIGRPLEFYTQFGL